VSDRPAFEGESGIQGHVAAEPDGDLGRRGRIPPGDTAESTTWSGSAGGCRAAQTADTTAAQIARKSATNVRPESSLWLSVILYGCQ
jgi:hypothetical protein